MNPVPELQALALFSVGTTLYSIVMAMAVSWAGYDPLSNLDFSRRKFYLLMGWVPLGFIGVAFLGWRYVLFAGVAALSGVVGELLVSVVWRSFFAVPIWTYSYGSILRSYTSTINLLPWAVGGLIFQQVGIAVDLSARFFGAEIPSGPPFAAMTVAAGALLAGLGLALMLRARVGSGDADGGGSGRFSRRRFWVFCLPIACTAVALAVLRSPRYLMLMALFAVIGFATEYIYGRTMACFFHRPLWVYNHWQIDDGHSSVVTLPLWSLGGLYFYFIAGCLGL